MSRKLIVSLDTYSWVRFVAGTIIRDHINDYEVIIVHEDLRPILWMRNLCVPAIIEQRRHDLYQVGTTLNIKKISNFKYTYGNVPIKKLITELHLYIILNSISEVYIQSHDILNIIFKELQLKYNFKLFIFGSNTDDVIKKTILTQDEYKEKIELRKLLVGIHTKEDRDVYTTIERFTGGS